MAEIYGIAILCGGPGGYVAALRAAQLGARVALVEKERVGGTCLNIGCIPTKALATSTELLLKARRANEFGISIPDAQPDLPRLMAYKQSTVDGLVSGVEQLLKERKVTLVRGSGRLVRPGALQVVRGDGAASEISARHIILAPGSITARPPIPGSDLRGVISSTEALDITEIPDRLIVIGGGVIGLEFACIYEALGSRVTVLEMMPILLPGGTDDSLAKRLALILRRRGMAVHTGATVQAIEPAENGLRVKFSEAKGAGAVEGERVLVAVGRWPNTDGLGLAELGVKMNGRAIAVDEHMATNVPNVWAIGDAVGAPSVMLAHKAMVEGRVVAFDYEQNKPVVVAPHMCMVGCTTCAKTCAEDAIDFPSRGYIRQLINWNDVHSGRLAYLLVDLPPGTSDAALTVMQSLPLDGVLMVTTPQSLSALVVRKAVQMAQVVGARILGIVENMAGFVAPDTGVWYDIFGPSHAEEMAAMAGAPVLARIPIDSQIAAMCDAGEIESVAWPELEALLAALAERLGEPASREAVAP